MELSQNLSNAIIDSVTILKEIIQIESKLNEVTPVEFLRSQDSKQSEILFEPYKKKYTAFNPELVWEYSGIGNHYQTILFDGDETITVSVCPNHYIPWALRNAVHSREQDFVVINGHTLSIVNLMEIIDEHLDNKNIRESIINRVILKHQLDQITEDEDKLYQPTQMQLQIEFDRWRLERGLATVDSYNEYLQINGLTHQKIEAQIKDKRTYNNFLESLCQNPIEDYYSQHTAEFTRYKMESYIAESEDEARELSEFLQSNPDGLCIWARNQFLSQSENIAQNTYQLNTCWNYQLDSEVAEILAKNPKTGLISPIKMNGKITFINILSIIPPILDHQVESIIRQKQVKEWIDEKKKTLSIQWLWGDKDIFPNQNIQEV